MIVKVNVQVYNESPDLDLCYNNEIKMVIEQFLPAKAIQSMVAQAAKNLLSVENYDIRGWLYGGQSE